MLIFYILQGDYIYVYIYMTCMSVYKWSFDIHFHKRHLLGRHDRCSKQPSCAKKGRLTHQISSRACKETTMIPSSRFVQRENQWEFQDPKMEVRYHIRPYLWGCSLKFRPYIGLIYDRYIQFRILEWPLRKWDNNWDQPS